MKISQMATALFLISHAALAENFMDLQMPGGNMRFQGVVMAETCSVTLSAGQMLIQMGSLKDYIFRDTGEYSDPVPFDISFQDCNAVVSQRVGVSFRGISDVREPDLLSVDDDQGNTDGIAIALFSEKGKQIKLNQPSEIWSKLVNEPLTLHMSARYKSTHYPVSGDKAHGQVWFSLTYQ